MKRRTFLHQIGYGLPATLALPSFLSSCNKSDDDGPGSNGKFKDYKVIVVGAGAAGLYAGWFLKKRGFQVTILEASNRIGGRIKAHSGFADYDIELGAERIYGSNTEWHKIVTASGKPFNPAQPEDHYFFRQEPSNLNEKPLKNRTLSNQYSHFTGAMNFIQQAPTYTGPDVNVESAFTTSGLWSMVGVMNGLIGNRLGTSNPRLGMKGYSQELAIRTADDQTFTLEKDTLLSVLEKKFSEVIGEVQLNKQVKKIDYQGEMVTVTTQSGQPLQADRVIVTVPLTVLKNGGIAFTPGLPVTKTDALEKFGMMGGLKIHLKFSTPFWKDIATANLGSVFGHNFLPEIYVSSLGRSQTPVLTLLLMGERAEQFATMGTTAVSVALSYLDEIFSSQIPTQSFVEGASHIMDWSKEPFINGAYSYPLVGSGLVFRKELAAPVDGKIFFAGEATNATGHSGTVHGAIETGMRVSMEIEESVS